MSESFLKISKFFRRAGLMSMNTLSGLAAPVSTMLLAYAVIRFASREVWGGTVYYILLFDFAFNFINWGQRDFLLREFSMSPMNVQKLWRQSFRQRLPVLLLMLITIYFLYGQPVILFLIVWATARFFYQSLEPLIIFHRRFAFQFFAEAAGIFSALLLIFVCHENINVSVVVAAYTLSLLTKAVTGIIFFREVFRKTAPTRFNKKYFLLTLPFLLLTFSGMLQSKTDLYCAALFLPKDVVGQYQVLSGLLGFSLFASSTVLSPFAKNIYRFGNVAFSKLQKRYFVTGLVLGIFLTAAIWLVTKIIYGFSFATSIYLLVYFYLLPFYIYLPYMYQYTRDHKASQTVIILIVCSALVFISALLVTPLFGMAGALFAGVIGQWIIAIIYFARKSITLTSVAL